MKAIHWTDLYVTNRYCDALKHKCRYVFNGNIQIFARTEDDHYAIDSEEIKDCTFYCRIQAYYDVTTT